MKNDLPSDPTPSSTFPFLYLPLELRVLIYSIIHSWPDLRYLWKDQDSWQLYQYETRYEESRKPDPQSATQSHWHRCRKPEFKIKQSTPTVLLLNRQITAEAINVIYSKPLYLKTPSSVTHGLDIPNCYRIFDITRFISRESLQKVRRVYLDMNLTLDLTAPGNSQLAGWPGMIDGLIDTWEEKNSLEKLEACGCYEPASKVLGWSFQEAAHHKSVIILLSKLSNLQYSTHAPINLSSILMGTLCSG